MPWGYGDIVEPKMPTNYDRATDARNDLNRLQDSGSRCLTFKRSTLGHQDNLFAVHFAASNRALTILELNYLQEFLNARGKEFWEGVHLKMAERFEKARLAAVKEAEDILGGEKAPLLAAALMVGPSPAASNGILSKRLSDVEGFCVSSHKAFGRIRLRTYADLVEMRPEDLLGIRGFGQSSLYNVKSIMAKDGLSLKQGA